LLIDASVIEVIMPSMIEKAWDRVKKWYGNNLPAHIFTFDNGASLEEIRGVEKHLAVQFPQEIEESYLICNGLHRCGLSFYGYFNSLSEMVAIWDSFCRREIEKIEWPQPWLGDPDPAIKKVYWNRRRIPLTDNKDNNFVFLDLDPTDKGKAGQIIFLDRLEGTRIKLADCLSDWLNRFAEELEAGKYLFDADAESLIPEDQW
jgi:cell wall assembly regulator SMI1